jgi:hypothetical protein
MTLVLVFVFLMCCYCLECFNYVRDLPYGDVCVHVRDVKGTKSYIVNYVNLFKLVNEAYSFVR